MSKVEEKAFILFSACGTRRIPHMTYDVHTYVGTLFIYTVCGFPTLCYSFTIYLARTRQAAVLPTWQR